jgi:hypothetical protein
LRLAFASDYAVPFYGQLKKPACGEAFAESESE